VNESPHLKDELNSGQKSARSFYLSGVLWIRIDREGAWQLTLARELKAAVIEVDLNRLV